MSLVSTEPTANAHLIFASEAPKYWEKGLCAHPLIFRDKRPVLKGWQAFSDRHLTDDEMAMCLGQHGAGNIGLVCGAASGVLAIDLDSDDPRARKVIDHLLPQSPYERFGKKGMMFAYRYNGERSFKILGPNGKPIIECLSKGNQFALPPSIHPDTGQPYRSNVPLYEVVGALPSLPPNVEVLLRDGLRSAGLEVRSGSGAKFSVVVPAGGRDNALVSMAGILSQAVTRGERSLLEALAQIAQWVENYTQKVVGDEVSVEKAQAKLIEFLHRDVANDRSLPEGWDAGLSDEDKEKMGLSFTQADERWSAGRILEHFREQLLALDGDPYEPSWNDAVEFALERIAHGELTVTEEERLLKFISNQSKGAYSLSALKKRVKEIRNGDVLGQNHKEVAELALKEFARDGEVLFDAGRLWQCKGAFWKELEQIPLEGFITDKFGDCPGCKKHQDVRGIIKSMYGLSIGELAQVPVTGVNFANGFLTEDLELLSHSPAFGATYVLPYRYVPENAACPMFMQFLHDCWSEDPDFDDKVLALQEAFAATIMGIAPHYQRVFCLFGRPGAGKSRIPKILEGLLPGGCRASISPWDLKDRFLPAQLFGKRLNVAGEISETKKIAGDIFKLVVEGAEITAQNKNQPVFTFSPEAAHWFCGNHLPSTDDFSGGFTRRWLFLEFNQVVKREHKDVGLVERILDDEREQIAAWALQGLKRLKRNNDYTLPACHERLVSSMMMKNSPVHYFLSRDRHLRIGEKAHRGISNTRTTLAALHDRYWHFCMEIGGATRYPQPKFMQVMDELSHTFGFVKRLVSRGNGTEIEYEFITIRDRVTSARAA
jgi:P4 family phage/plasmid primase-like protien